MDEDIAVINTGTRIEKIKNFFIKNKKNLIVVISFTILVIIGYFGYEEYNKKKKIKIANKYNLSLISYNSGNTAGIESEMIKIINEKDKTYSPLALYFLIDNKISIIPIVLKSFKE